MTDVCEVLVDVGSGVDEAGRVGSSGRGLDVVSRSLEIVVICSAVGVEVVIAGGETVEWTMVVIWTVEDAVEVALSSVGDVVSASFGTDSMELELEMTAIVVGWAEEGTVTVKTPPPPVCVMCIFAVASDTWEVAFALMLSTVGLELASEETVRLEYGTVTLAAAPPPVCVFCAFVVASDSMEASPTVVEPIVGLELVSTVVDGAEDGTVAVRNPPPLVLCVFGIVSNAWEVASAEVESTLGL